MLRHTVATLAYRGGKVLRDAPNGFGEYRQEPGSRSAVEILAHMGDLMDWAVSIAEGRQAWKDSPPLRWDEEVERFFGGLARFDALVAGMDPADALGPKLFQGPVADALTHVGQLAVMRRMAGAPIRGENYFKADITAGRVGLDQAAPKREF